MTKFGRSVVLMSALGLAGTWACSSPAPRGGNEGGEGGDEATGGAGTGGKATGGKPGTGGASATGGATGTGGATATGGSTGTGGSGGSTGGSSGSPDAGMDGGGSGGSAGGPLSITVDHVVDMMPMRLCFKPDACNMGGQGNKSPKIDWTGLPEGTKSLVLTTEDLSNTPTCHQIICNIPPTVMGHPADAKGMVPMGAQASYGHNGKTGWYGPGADMRNYEIKIWALATDTFEMGCGGGGTAARGHCARLKSMANNKAVVLGTASKVLWGQQTGQGCP